MKKIFLLGTLLCSLAAITACDVTEEPEPDPVEDPVEDHEQVKPSYDYMTYDTREDATMYGEFLSSTGEPNVLVVPVQFSGGESFTDAQLEMLDATFNGYYEDGTTPYWESVSSFYNESSYGKLDINFVLTDVYTSSISDSYFVQLDLSSTSYVTGVEYLMSECRNLLTINGEVVDYSDYDIDENGYIDAVWFIYAEPYQYNARYRDYEYWAYVGWVDNEANIDDPQFRVYANASIDFMYDYSSAGYDSHTYIHETGHLMGLEDYYDYDYYYSCSGGLMMEQLNIGDHDPFSKYTLGWLNPTVVEESGTYTLESLTQSGDALIIPTSSEYYGDAFGEYLIIQYYTPDGLNELDSTSAYYSPVNGTYPKMYDEEGFLIYHIDARIYEFVYGTYYGESGYYLNGFVSTHEGLEEFSDTDSYIYEVGQSNSYYYSYSGYNLIELISADNTVFYPDGRGEYASNDSLFKVGDFFKPTDYYYLNNGIFNNGEEMEFVVQFDSIVDGTATLTVLVGEDADNFL